MAKFTSKEIVNNALEMSDTEIHNAIISLIFTTGLHKNIIRDITIGDLVKAADMCFKEDEPHTIKVLINKKDTDMFLCWTFEKDSKHQVIFSSPNTTKYIIKYLKHNEKFYDFENLDELFRTKDAKTNKYTKIKDNYISSTFYECWRKLNFPSFS